MPKRKGPEPKPEGQFKEFVKTARELGVDESGEALESFRIKSKHIRRCEGSLRIRLG